VLCVGSWDHLSSKALLRQMPERVVVWNDVQKQEAIKLHRVPANRVSVTGAQSYDHWFNRAPARSRAEFCHRVGLARGRSPQLAWVPEHNHTSIVAHLDAGDGDEGFGRQLLSFARSLAPSP